MNVAEEEVILWVTSDLCPTSSVTPNPIETTVSASAIPVALISRNQDDCIGVEHIETLQFEDAKEEYCVMEEEIINANEKKSRKRGIVWNYFVPTSTDRAQCSFCSADISYKGKSTNNLLRHLRTKHSESNAKRETTEQKSENCMSENGSTYYLLSAPNSEQSHSPVHSPASSTSVSIVNEEEQNVFKRRGGVWKFFSTDSNKRAKCKLCMTMISFKGGSTTNLLRHMKSKHSCVKVPSRIHDRSDPLKLSSSSKSTSLQHSFAEIVNECVKSDDENDYQPIHHIQLNDGNDISDCLDENDHIENITTLSSMDPSFSRNPIDQDTAETTHRKKFALAWKYFTLASEDRGRCSSCDALISFKGGSTGNLLRHLKTKHSEIDLTPSEKKDEPEVAAENEEKPSLETIENAELAKFVQLLNPKYKLQGVKVPKLNEKDEPKRIRKRGIALNYFEITANEFGKCQICAATVPFKNGSKAPLLRHLKAKHPDTDTLLVATNGSAEEIVIEQQTVNIENIENIPMSINQTESASKEKAPRKMRKRGLVWNHFAPLEDEKAKCITCPAVISYKRGSTSNLLRHMKKKHPDIDVLDEDRLKVDETVDSPSSGDENEDPDCITDKKSARKLLRKRGRVWNYFKPIAPDKAKCGLCNSVIIYLKGSTTNLLRHMKKKHSSIDLSKEKPFNKCLTYPRQSSRSDRGSISSRASAEYMQIEENYESENNNTVSVIKGNSNSSSSQSEPERMNAIYKRSEIIFRKHFDKFLNRPVSVTKSKQYDEQLAKMIVKQYCPFTIVESEEFKKFVQTVNPGYSLPSRKTISSRLIPELYEKCAEEVRERLRNIRYATVTTNGWTLINSECYISITVHFIDEECCFQSYLLDCFRYEEKNTAENLAAEIKTILTEWGLIHKVNAVVSDNAANITAAIRLRSWRHIPCFANMLNLVVQAGLLEIRQIYDKAKLIVEHVRKNHACAKKFANFQRETGAAPMKLKLDDPNRWDSTYDMFQRLISCKDVLHRLNSHLGGENLSLPNEYEWQLLERICATLKPFLEITNEVSEKNVTISKVIPLSRCITNYLKRLLVDQHLCKELTSAVNKMLEEMILRFSDVEDNTMLAESTLLDPRFKNQAFVNEQSYSNTYHSILQKASHVKLSDRTVENVPVAATAAVKSDSIKQETDTSKIWEEFDTQVSQMNDEQNPEKAASAEMENYLQETLLNRNADPLIWWKERKSIYPRLFEIMKQRLCIAATAVSKNFTNGGQLVCEKRNKLSPPKVSMVLFLNHNL